MIRRDARQSAAFKNYWRRYILSDEKRKVLRRGEMGFSQALFRAGFERAGLISRNDFRARIRQEDDAFLCKTLRWSSYVEDPKFQQECDALLAQAPPAPDWRDRVIELIDRTVLRDTFHDTFRYAIEQFYDVALLKRRNIPHTLGVRRMTIEAIDAGVLPPFLPVIDAEVRASL